MKKTVFIFGISSFVGSNLAQLLKDEFRIIGTYHSVPVEIPGVLCVPCDVLQKDYVNSLLGIFRPDFTIYAAGLSSLNECSLHPKLADALNTVGAINCCVASERIGSKFVFLSSCFVLGGEENHLYKEGDTPFPNTVYGTTISSTEFYIQRSCLNYLILRCSPLYGRSYSPKHENWFEIVQAGFAKNQAIYADDTVYTGFMDIYILAKILLSTLKANVTNRLLQVSTKDSVTRYDFARIYARIFHRDEGLIQKVNGRFPAETFTVMKTSAKSHYHYSMDISNIEEFLGTKMPRVEDSLKLTLKRLTARI